MLADIAALKARGLSFAEIGDRLGTSKDSAQKLYRRHVAQDTAGNVGLHAVGSMGSTKASGMARVALSGPWAARGGVAVPELPVSDPPAQRKPGEGPVGEPPVWVGLDVGFFDFETEGLVADFAELLCACCAHSDGSIVVLRRDEKRFRARDDRKLAVAIRDHLEQHDIIVGYNSKSRQGLKGPGGFDIRFLQTRLLEAGERSFREPIHLDLLPIMGSGGRSVQLVIADRTA